MFIIYNLALYHISVLILIRLNRVIDAMKINSDQHETYAKSNTSICVNVKEIIEKIIENINYLETPAFSFV